MYCPKCGARTEVSETRGVFRDRRCTNPACGLNFTTRESVITLGDRGRLCARTHFRGERPPASVAAPVHRESASAPARGAPPVPGESVRGFSSHDYTPSRQED